MKNRRAFLIRLEILLLYILIFIALIVNQANKSELATLISGFAMIYGGIIGLINKSITFLPPSKTLTKYHYTNNYYGDKDLMYLVGIIVNALCIVIGLGIAANAYY